MAEPVGESKGLWSATTRDLRAAKWKQRVLAMEAASQDLEEQVLRSYRFPAVSERDSELYGKFKARLQRCYAFGQFADAVADDLQPRAQHGLFGSSAAFYILSRSRWAAEPTSTGEIYDHWHTRYLGTLNFLDFAVTSEKELHKGAWAQREMVLRTCLVLRAMAAASDPLTRFTIKDEDRLVVNDLSTGVAALCRHLTSVLFAFIEKCAFDPSSIDHAYAVGNNSAERSWLFSIGDDAAPKVVDEWVFVWAQVLGSLSRCVESGLLTPDQLTAVCSEESFRAVRQTVLNPPPDLDRRFQLLGLWAVAHFDHSTPHGPFDVRPGADIALSRTHLTLSNDQVADLDRTIDGLAAQLLDAEVSLVDSWRPYSLKPSGKEWRDDYMVVPVVPILLDLMARYRPRFLTNEPVLRLIRQLGEPSERRDVGRARPYQTGNRDGVVNLAYYHDALRQLGTAFSEHEGAVGKRWRATWSAIWRGYGKFVVIGTAVAIAGGAYIALVNSPSSVALGLIFGLAAAFLSAIVTPPIIAFFWGDRY